MCLVFVPIVSRETKAWKTKIISKEICLRFGFQLTVFLAHHLITPHCLFWFIAPILKHLICPLCWCHAFSQLYTTLPPLLGIPFASVSIWQTHLTQYSHLSTVHLTVSTVFCDAYLPVGMPQFQSLCLVHLYFPTQTLLHKSSVLYTFVNCLWLLSKAVVLIYHDVLTEKNKTFKE